MGWAVTMASRMPSDFKEGNHQLWKNFSSISFSKLSMSSNKYVIQFMRKVSVLLQTLEKTVAIKYDIKRLRSQLLFIVINFPSSK